MKNGIKYDTEIKSAGSLERPIVIFSFQRYP